MKVAVNWPWHLREHRALLNGSDREVIGSLFYIVYPYIYNLSRFFFYLLNTTLKRKYLFVPFDVMAEASLRQVSSLSLIRT